MARTYRFWPAAVAAVALVVTIGFDGPSPALQAQEAGAVGATAESVVDQLAQAIKGLESLQVVGKSKLEQKAGGRTQNQEIPFELAVLRSGRFYFKTQQGPAGFAAIWDGSVGWVSSFHDGQYQSHENLPGPEAFIELTQGVVNLIGMPLTYAQFVLAEDPKLALTTGVARMELTGAGPAGDYQLTLHRQRGDVVTMTVAKTDFLLRGMRVDLTPVIRNQLTQQGRTVPSDFSLTVTVSFDKSKRDGRIDQSTFAFTPPAGAELVEHFGPQPLTGKPAPDFTLSSLTGQPVALSGLKGKVVVVDFWATWCPPCRAAMPHLEKLHQEFAEKGLVVLGITDEDKATAEPFLKEHGITFTILRDPQNKVAQAYRVSGIPRTVIIDTEGKVATDFTGLQPEQRLRSALKEAGIE